MKRFFTFFNIYFLAFGLHGVLSAQTLELSNENGVQMQYGDTLFISGTPQTSEMVAHVKVKNISSGSVSVSCSKTYMYIVPGTSNVFCWANSCYPPTTFNSLSMTIAPDSIVDDFSGHYYPANNAGISVILYTFKIPHGDSAWFFAKFDATGQGINSNNISKLSKPYPNPANSNINIPFSIRSNQNGIIEVYDILGKLKTSIVAPAKNSNITIPLIDFNNGIYFIQLKVNGKVAGTEKIIVKH